MILMQAIVYAVFLKPKITTWGATEAEVKMPLIGDDLAPAISATRAITINASISEVWKTVIQMGADRGGFFSYTFIEKALGYEEKSADESSPELLEMNVGRIVPGSLDQSKSVIKYNFPVVRVEPGKSFVLENWGTFHLLKISEKQTRLIVRSHGRRLSGLKNRIMDFFEIPMHYIMERRMLMGMKAAAEADKGGGISEVSDYLWFLGVLLSAVVIFLMAFISRGILVTLLTTVYGIVWLWPLLIFDPTPLYGMVLLAIAGLTIIAYKYKRDRKLV